MQEEKASRESGVAASYGPRVLSWDPQEAGKVPRMLQRWLGVDSGVRTGHSLIEGQCLLVGAIGVSDSQG